MIGYKALRLDAKGCIHSLYGSHLWTAEGNLAACQFDNSGLTHGSNRKWGELPCPNPPDPSCYCGFYCYPSPEMAVHSPAAEWEYLILALVGLYGRVIEHEDGVMRSEWMSILAITALPFPYWEEVVYYYDRTPRLGNVGDLLRIAAEPLHIPWQSCDDVPSLCAWLTEKGAAA